MKIVLSGVETNNKGAELMLYAILQEIERTYPNSIVYINSDKLRQGVSYLHTPLSMVVVKPRIIYTVVKKLHLLNILNRAHVRILPHINSFVKGADWFIDGSGLHFCDQFKHDAKRVAFWRNTLSRQRADGAKIVFLPQGFGPFEIEGTRESIKAVSEYAHLIYAREQKSFDYLRDSGVVNMEKVKICPDFTCLVDGVFPDKYSKLRNAVCIIPNKRMLTHGNLTKAEYIDFIRALVKLVKRSGREVYLLNHEGKGDELLIKECKQLLGPNVEMVTGLNALETKGLISSAYLVISSRFHGVASALNSCVPCLATSWSHKYAYLYKDYGMEDCILTVKDTPADLKLIERYLDRDKNRMLRDHLKEIQPQLQAEIRDMWKEIWSTK